MKNVFFLLTLVPYLFGFTQELQTPRCIFDSLIQDAYTSEDFRILMYHEEQEIQDILKNKSLLSENATIPVVIHIVKNPNDMDMNITDEMVYRQLEILNETYNQNNTDIENTPGFFEPLIGNVGFEFCLATVDPLGYSTPGITRNFTDVSVFSTVSNNIKYASEGGVDAWDTDSYLNIWVGKLSSSILGYSHIPSATVPDQEQGVVINYPFFGETNHSFYNMGKTLVHEIGHYFNLRHPWGNGNCDQNNDFVDDTPISESAYAGSPVHPQTSCETIDMFMNFMDYVYDSSMVMFSIGQAERMQTALQYFRSGILVSNGCGVPSLIVKPAILHASEVDANDASIELNIVSGIPPFTIQWESGEETNYLADIDTGLYSVMIIDSIGQELILDLIVSHYGLVYDSDNFESYNSDSLLDDQSDDWFAFCLDTFSANISSVSAPEGIQYLEINSIDGTNTFARNLGGFTSNAYELSFDLYLPLGRSAGYTLYHDASMCSNPTTAFQLQFGINGIGTVNHGGDSSSFNFSQNEWLQVSHLIDLDRDLVEFFINDVKILDWTFSETISTINGNTTLHTIVFNDSVNSIDQTHYFIDDYKLKLVQNSTLNLDEFEQSLELIVYPNPTSGILTLESAISNPKDCSVSIFNALGMLLEFTKWDQTLNNSIQFNLDYFREGVYFMRVESEKENKLIKFVVTR